MGVYSINNFKFIQMEFLEKDLEQIIWEASDKELRERGLFLLGKRFRQLRIGNYGIADLVTVHRQQKYEDFIYGKLIITVYELKKDKIGISAFLQALNYCKGISSYLEKREFSDYTLSIVLVGKSIDSSGSFIYLTDLIGNYSDNYDKGYINEINYYTYSYKIDGLSFKGESGYSLTDEGFWYGF